MTCVTKSANLTESHSFCPNSNIPFISKISYTSLFIYCQSPWLILPLLPDHELPKGLVSITLLNLQLILSVSIAF